MQSLQYSITGDNTDIHPVAFWSRTLGPLELNYDTHGKECFAIFDAFTIWRHYLEGSAFPVDVETVSMRSPCVL